jgi:hypothetical protein
VNPVEKPPNKGSRITDEEIEQIKSLYAQGFGVREVAERVRRSYGSVQRHLTSAGLIRTRDEGWRARQQRQH